MDGRLAPQITLSLVTTALLLWLAVYAWKRRPASGATLFTVWMLALAQWSLAHTLEISSSDLAISLFWARFQFLGMAMAPVVWLSFVLEFTGREAWFTRRNLLLLTVIPAVTFVLALTNTAHGLIWQQVTLATAVSPPTLSFTYGVWYWIYLTFSFSCLLIAFGYLSASWRQETTAVSRWQLVLLQIGLVLPWIGNVMGSSLLDWTSVGFLLSSLIFLHYTLRFRLFDLTPVAHRTLVDSMKDSMLVLDTQGRIMDANPAAITLIDRMPAAFLGKQLTDIWPDLAASMATGDELTWGTAESPRHYEVTVSALYDWRKQPRGRLLVLHDITERKEMEALRADMTRDMVHDLRAPISNSLFALEMLKGELVDEPSADSHQLLEMTFANTEKTLQLVNEILELSRLESDRNLSVNFTAVSLQQLACDIVKTQSPRALDKQISLTCDIPESLPPAWADARLLERVLQNLVDNSLKFTPPGGQVSVSARVAQIGEHAPGSADYLVIEVKDSGPGIPSAFQEQVFQKFVTGNHKESGSGLGLAFCKMAVAAHGERIWVDSQPGQGSAFKFTLAVARQAPRFLHPRPAAQPGAVLLN